MNDQQFKHPQLPKAAKGVDGLDAINRRRTAGRPADTLVRRCGLRKNFVWGDVLGGGRAFRLVGGGCGHLRMSKARLAT